MTLLWQWTSVRDRKPFGLLNLISPPVTICKQWMLRSETERKLGNSVFFRRGKGKYWTVYYKNSLLALGVRWHTLPAGDFELSSPVKACGNTSVTCALQALTRKGLAKSSTYHLRNRSSCPGDSIWFMSRGRLPSTYSDHRAQCPSTLPLCLGSASLSSIILCHCHQLSSLRYQCDRAKHLIIANFHILMPHE